jgi:hypothetical protein
MVEFLFKSLGMWSSWSRCLDTSAKLSNTNIALTRTISSSPSLLEMLDHDLGGRLGGGIRGCSSCGCTDELELEIAALSPNGPSDSELLIEIGVCGLVVLMVGRCDVEFTAAAFKLCQFPSKPSLSKMKEWTLNALGQSFTRTRRYRRIK